MKLEDLKRANEIIAEKELIIQEQPECHILLGKLYDPDGPDEYFKNTDLPADLVSKLREELKVTFNKVVNVYVDSLQEEFDKLGEPEMHPPGIPTTN